MTQPPPTSAAGYEQDHVLQRWRHHAASLPGPLPLAGITLLVASEFTDRLEPEIGVNVINLYFAFSIAALVACVGALVGDTILSAIERRSGQRIGATHVALLLAVPGAAAIAEILAHHLHRPPALDAWFGLAGATSLLIAAAVHRLARPRRTRQTLALAMDAAHTPSRPPLRMRPLWPRPSSDLAGRPRNDSPDAVGILDRRNARARSADDGAQPDHSQPL
jgi:hypothetical protein